MTSKFACGAGEGPVTVDVVSRALELDIRRSVFSRAFTMCLWIVNWALFARTMYVTLAIAVNAQKVTDVVLALLITVILTVPAIRALYVGEPPFGILLGICPGSHFPHVDADADFCCWIDVVGLFSQITLVALYYLVLLYLVTKPPPSRDLKL